MSTGQNYVDMSKLCRQVEIISKVEIMSTGRNYVDRSKLSRHAEIMLTGRNYVVCFLKFEFTFSATIKLNNH